MTTAPSRQFVFTTLMGRFASNHARRHEALSDVLGLTVPGVDETAAQSIARLVPMLPQSMYEKWVNLFCDTFFATTPQSQLAHLCTPGEENEAVLALVFLMFMESARMEQVIAQDLRTLGIAVGSSDEEGAAIGLWLRQKMTAGSH